MTIEQLKQSVVDALSAISVRSGSEESDVEIQAKIQETANALAPLMQEKMLLVAKGSSAPTAQRAYQSLYLEYPGASHNSKHKAYANVICHYEWQTRSKYGFAPVPQCEFSSVCDSLVRKAKSVEPFVNLVDHDSAQAI